MTSVLTMHEVLVKPLRVGHHDIADKYREVLTNSANVTLHAIDLSICGIAASLRAKYKWLRAPDALQIGTAIGLGAPIIVTNDQRWSQVTEVGVLVLRDLI
jgi:predicted nucleic acid-binding protein